MKFKYNFIVLLIFCNSMLSAPKKITSESEKKLLKNQECTINDDPQNPKNPECEEGLECKMQHTGISKCKPVAKKENK